MQATAGCHQLILNVFPPQPEGVFDNPAPFHTANHMLDSHPHARNPLVLHFLIRGQRPTAWFFLGLFDADLGHTKALKAHILIQDTVAWEAIVFLIRHGFVVPTPFVGGTQKRNRAVLPDQQQILDRMLLVLAAIVKPLFIGITRPVYRSFGPVVEKRDGSSAAAPEGASTALIRAVRLGRTPCVASA